MKEKQASKPVQYHDELLRLQYESDDDDATRWEELPRNKTKCANGRTNSKQEKQSKLAFFDVFFLLFNLKIIIVFCSFFNFLNVSVPSGTKLFQNLSFLIGDC